MQMRLCNDSLPLVSQIRQSQRGSKIAIKSGQWSVCHQMYMAIVEGVKDCHKKWTVVCLSSDVYGNRRGGQRLP